MGESLVGLSDEEMKLPEWKLGAGWKHEWGRGKLKGRRAPLQLVLVLVLVEGQWQAECRWVDWKVEQ